MLEVALHRLANIFIVIADDAIAMLHQILRKILIKLAFDTCCGRNHHCGFNRIGSKHRRRQCGRVFGGYLNGLLRRV